MILAAALILGLVGYTTGTTLATLQIAQAVALAALLLHLGLWAWHRFDGGGPGVDLAVVTLVAVGLGAGWSSGPGLGCAQRILPAQIENVLFLGGAGAAIVMGATSLMLPFRSLAVRRKWDHQFPTRTELCGFMKGATAVALLVLAIGLVLGAWWAWRVLGRLVGDDLRWGWMAAAWLLALVGWLAWRLARRGAPVAVVLSLLAALVANVGVLAAEPLPHWLGF
jgi:hypothetical protein